MSAKATNLRRMGIIANALACMHPQEFRVVLKDGEFIASDSGARLVIQDAGIAGEVDTSLRTFRAAMKGAKGNLEIGLGTIGGLPVPSDAVGEFDSLRTAIDDEWCVAMDGGEFGAGLPDVAFAMSTEEARYYLRGVYFTASPFDTMRFVSTDGHRLAMFDTSAPVSLQAMATWPNCGVAVKNRTVSGVIVNSPHVKALIQLQRYFPAETVTMATEGERVTFYGGDKWNLTVRRVDGAYPSYESIMQGIADDPATFSIDVDLAEIAPIVDRAASVSAMNGNSVAVFDKNSPSVHDIDVDALRWEFGATLGMTAKSIVDAAKVMPRPTMRFSTNDKGHVRDPFTMQTADKPGLTIVQMPLPVS